MMVIRNMSICRALFLIWFFFDFTLSSHSLTRVTNKAFDEALAQNAGRLSAFWDLNEDRQADIITSRIRGNTVEILSWVSKDSKDHQTLSQMPLLSVTVPTNSSASRLVGVTPAFFDADERVDLLLTFEEMKLAGSFPRMQSIIYLAHYDSTFSSDNQHDLGVHSDEPPIIDFNGEGRPNLLVTSANNGPNYVLSFNDTGYPEKSVPVFGDVSMKNPHSHATAALTGDLFPDVLLTTTTDVKVFNIQIKPPKPLASIPYPTGILLNSSIIVTSDFDTDGTIDVLLICEQGIYLAVNNQFQLLAASDNLFGSGGTDVRWQFSVSPTSAQVSFIMGDVDNDMYPDAITVLQRGNDSQAFLLRNVKCTDSRESACPSSRTFQILWDSDLLGSYSNVEVAAFYDYESNGALDILLSLNDGSIELLQSSYAQDGSFVKVTVSSEACSSCAADQVFRNPYGPTVRYMSTHTDGTTVRARATQLSQSAHASLQLPFTIFGLGSTPNFVDSLTVGIPNNKEQVDRTWTTVIPNSHLIVVPSPMDNPSSWYYSLLVRPGRAVLETAGALLGTCFFVMAIIGLLHWKEKREDKAAKIQQSKSFNFNAM